MIIKQIQSIFLLTFHLLHMKVIFFQLKNNLFLLNLVNHYYFKIFLDLLLSQFYLLKLFD